METPAPSSKSSQLLDTAWRLFRVDGYQRVGIDLILAESGIAKKTLYHHFKSKDDLIVALLDRQNGAILKTLDARIEAAGSAPRKRFLAVFDWLGEWIEGPDFCGCAFSRAISEFPNAAHPVHRAAWRFKESVRARFRQSAVTPIADAAMLLFEGAIGIASGSGNSDSAKVARASARGLLEGQGKARGQAA